jgi:hypothetical protein
MAEYVSTFHCDICQEVFEWHSVFWHYISIHGMVLMQFIFLFYIVLHFFVFRVLIVWIKFVLSVIFLERQCTFWFTYVMFVEINPGNTAANESNSLLQSLVAKRFPGSRCSGVDCSASILPFVLNCTNSTLLSNDENDFCVMPHFNLVCIHHL